MGERAKREWFDDDAFWIELFPFMFSEQRFVDAVADKLVTLAAARGKAILDLCCGPGRFSIPLAGKGFAVTGVDRTAFLLDKARARAERAGVTIEWIQADMRDFVRPGAFDVVLSLFTSFGYFDDKQDDLTVLSNMLASLEPGGTCVIEVFGKERLARVLQPTTSESLPDGSVLLHRHEIFDDWTRIRNELTLIRDGRARTFTFHHTVYSGQELRDRLEAIGFREVKLYGSLDGDPYGPLAQRLIAVARKPAD